MNLIKELVQQLYWKRKPHYKYKVVDFDDKKLNVYLLCLSSKAVSPMNLSLLERNETVKKQLIPEQACYLGMQYSLAVISKHSKLIVREPRKESNISNDSWVILDRNHNLIYYDQRKKETNSYNIHFVVTEKNEINKFPSEVAFRVGQLYGFLDVEKITPKTKKHLKIIK